jgi:flavin reductase (DIM6/NTAB) family NADH-FMN oxidoreductase RutF
MNLRVSGSRRAPAAPMTGLVDAFRLAMRAHPAGVTIITTNVGGRSFGMTATAVTSLCMTPPALTICVNRDASIYPALLERGLFCVNLLRADAAGFCRKFSAAASADRFSHGDWERNDHGLPTLAGSQATMTCRVGPRLDFGTHAIIVGEVLDVAAGTEISPLIYVDGSYLSAGSAA